jgi:hypothetical protein
MYRLIMDSDEATNGFEVQIRYATAMAAKIGMPRNSIFDVFLARCFQINLLLKSSK